MAYSRSIFYPFYRLLFSSLNGFREPGYWVLSLTHLAWILQESKDVDDVLGVMGMNGLRESGRNRTGPEVDCFWSLS